MAHVYLRKDLYDQVVRLTIDNHPVDVNEFVNGCVQKRLKELKVIR